MRLAKLFFASILFIFGSLFFVSTASAQGSGETSFLSNFDFSMYGDSTGRVGSYSYYAPAGFSTALPSLDLARSKFGPGSLLFRSDGKYHSILQYFSAGQEISLVGGEFTIDFWVYPTEYDINSSYSFFRFCSDASCKKYLLFWKSFGHADYNNPDYTASDKRFSFKYYDEDTLLTVPAGGEVAPGQYASRFYVIPKKGVDLVPNQWNHIALQRKNQDGQAYVNLAINGQASPWKKFYVNSAITLPSFRGIDLGDIYYYPGAPMFRGSIDDFRVIKDRAIWRDVPDNGTFSVPTNGEYSNTVVDQNKIVTPIAPTISPHVISLGNTTDITESNVTYATCPPGSARPSIREEYLTKIDGTPKLTSYFDLNNKLICTVYWSDNATTTTSKKLKRFEYDADGQITREIYYGVDGASITDTVTYFSKSAGGARQKEIQNRNGAEYYKRYSTTGRLLYEHEYKNGQYVVSRNFTYDGAGRLASELVFSSPGKYEKIVYTRNGSGVVTQTDIYRAYAPIGTDMANYVHTVSTYTGTVVTGITRTYFNKDAGSPTALRTEIARYNTSGVAIDQRTFDYAQNKQKFSAYITTGTATLLGRLKTDEEWSTTDYSYASSSLAYNATTGELLSWSKVNYDDMSARGATAGYYWTKYTIYNVKTGLPKEEWRYDRWPSLNIKQINSAVYDDKGAVSIRRSYDYRDERDLYSHTITKYTKDGLIQLVNKNNDVTGIRTYAEVYYGNGEIWYIQNYQYNTPAANQYTINYFRVNYRNSLSTSTASDLVADGSVVYTKDFAFVSESVPVDVLSQKKIGDKIIANISDAPLRGQAEGGAEKVAIHSVLKALLPEYKNALLAVSEGDLLKKEKRYEIYVAYASRITRAIYAIEYRFHNGSPKYLNTDTTLDKAVTGWYGIDGSDLSSNTEFWGLYIRPGKVDSADVEAVYVDMSILNPSAVDFAIGASSYDVLKNTPKKIEKWDVLRSGAGFSFANNTLSIFNLSGGVGRYITLDELTRADPTVNLTLNRFEEDMINSGVNLSNLSETQVIEKMYQYFDKQSYFSYLYDLSQVTQTVNQTLVRKGGDCEDFGLFFLSLLREEFRRLGNTDALSRLGLITVYVDSNAVISESNQGAGHASVGFRQGSTYYYIEASYLFTGSGADSARPTPRALNPLSGYGSTVAGTLGQSGWYVQAADMYPLSGSRIAFSGSLGVFHDTTSQTNSVDSTVAQVSNIYTKLEPYNPLVTTLASSTVQAIPNFKNQSVEFVVESTHSFFNRLAQYVPESGEADVWRGIDQTIPAVINSDGTVNLTGKISGDCEDLAFAEASLLENVLLRHYIAGGELPDNAINQAKKSVIIVAEKDYGGVAGRAHLYVGFLTPKTATSPAVVRLIDPQLGTIGAPMLMSDLYNEKYLFFSDREKVSAITPYDWSSFRLSSAVKAAAAEGVVLFPTPVDPKAPVAQNLTATQQAAIINAMVTEPPPVSTLQKIINFAYKASGLQAVVEATTSAERVIRVAVAAALSIGGGPVATAVNVGVALINLASEAMTGKPIIINSSDAGVAVGNVIISIINSVGGPKSEALATAEAAYAQGRTTPAGPMNTGPNAENVGCSGAACGVVFVQRNRTTSVVQAISSTETSRTTETRSYNPNTNVMTVTTHTTIVIPLSPYFSSGGYGFIPPVNCAVGIPLCSSVNDEVVTAPDHSILSSASLGTCYVSGQYPSCETRQYNTTWSCNPGYSMTTASATQCTCTTPSASNYGSVGTCQYGATISCAAGNPPTGDPVTGLGVDPNTLAVSSYPAPAGESSSTILWGYLLTATSSNKWCKWSCAAGFTVNPGQTQCVPNPFSCVPPVVPGLTADKIQNCPGDNDPASASETTGTFVQNCSSPDGSFPKCEYRCADGRRKVGNTCLCQVGQTENQFGVCVPDGTVVTSQVNLSAFSPVTGGGYSSTPAPDRTLTVRKAQAFKVAWSQGNSALQDLSLSPANGYSCFTSVSKVGDSAWREPSSGTKWAAGSLLLEGNVAGLSLNQSGSYTYNATCEYGDHRNSSAAPPVTIIVAPSGAFEEF